MFEFFRCNLWNSLNHIIALQKWQYQYQKEWSYININPGNKFSNPGLQPIIKQSNLYYCIPHVIILELTADDKAKSKCIGLLNFSSALFWLGSPSICTTPPFPLPIFHLLKLLLFWVWEFQISITITIRVQRLDLN